MSWLWKPIDRHLRPVRIAVRVERDHHPCVVARRVEVDLDRALVGLDARDEVDHVHERQPLERPELGEPPACVV